jgi:hypothetical protein
VAVFDPQWLAIWWWPWLVWWLVTAVCSAVPVLYAARYLSRRDRRSRRHGRLLDMCFYLHEQRVMDIYEVGGFAEALEAEVADKINVNRDWGLWGRIGRAGGKAGGGVNKERVTTYLRESTPIKVIRVLMDTMRREDIVVDADLITGHLLLNRALAETLRDRGDTGQVPLSAVMSEYVSVTGRFTARRTDRGDVELRAPYGTGTPSAHVRITCEEAAGRGEFRNEIYYQGEFQARCLGKVRTWNGTKGELTLDPIAIFR